LGYLGLGEPLDGVEAAGHPILGSEELALAGFGLDFEPPSLALQRLERDLCSEEKERGGGGGRGGLHPRNLKTGTKKAARTKKSKGQENVE
jgi:hypothetical protein